MPASIDDDKVYSDSGSSTRLFLVQVGMPEFDAEAYRLQQDMDKLGLSTVIGQQLKDFVMAVAASYWENPFHNFDHARHFGTPMVKLLERIVGSTDQDSSSKSGGGNKEHQWNLVAISLYTCSCGIATDPLTRSLPLSIMSTILGSIHSTSSGEMWKLPS